jgi:hypothetical protein
MRTTLDIAEDVLLAAKAIGRRERRSVGDVISELARRGLSPEQGAAASESSAFYGFKSLPASGVVVTDTIIDRLRNETGV